MKRFGGKLAKVAGVLVGLAPGAAMATDVWTAATTEVTTAATSVTALLMAAVAIPLAFLGFYVVKKVVGGAR